MATSISEIEIFWESLKAEGIKIVGDKDILERLG
jgi:hypothetical protein